MRFSNRKPKRIRNFLTLVVSPKAIPAGFIASAGFISLFFPAKTYSALTGADFLRGGL